MVSWVTTAIFQGILHYLTIFYSDLVIVLKAGALRVFTLSVENQQGHNDETFQSDLDEELAVSILPLYTQKLYTELYGIGTFIISIGLVSVPNNGAISVFNPYHGIQALE